MISKTLLSLGGVVCTTVAAGIYTWGPFSSESRKMSSYTKTFENFKKWEAKNKEYGGNYKLVDPKDEDWWRERGERFKGLYKGDWRDFRDKCFFEIGSVKEEGLDSVFGEHSDYFSRPEFLPTSFDFKSICKKFTNG